MIFNSSRCTKPGCGTLGVMSLDPFSDSDHKVQFYFCAIDFLYSLMHKKPELSMSWPFYDPFGTFFCQLLYYLSQNWASDDHFDVPKMPKSYLDQKLWHKTQFPVFCNFVRKNTENLWLINGHFRTISGQFLANCMKIFHKE